MNGSNGSTGAEGPAGPQGVQGPAGEVRVLDGGIVVGPAGASVLVTPVTIGGTTCPTGGVRITQLSDGGISNVCNGETGPAGPAITGTALAVGSASCTNGGVRLNFADGGTLAVCNGAAGSTGAMGPQGPTGLAGPQGPQGNVGPGGVAGPQGNAGPQGSPGPAGPTGSIGPAGPAGSPGAVLYLDGGIVIANGEWVAFAGFTQATYTGDLGGIAGANQKCSAEFSRSFLCTVSEFHRGESAIGAPGTGAWADYERDENGARSVSGCYANSLGAWSLGTNGDYAPLILPNGNRTDSNCNVTHALACCRNAPKSIFRGFTQATSNGNLGGIAGANQKCSAEFSNSFLCTVSDVHKGEPAVGAPGNGAWADYERDTNGARSVSGCYANSLGAWSLGTNGDYAPNILPNGNRTDSNCDVVHSLACCSH